MKVVTLTGLATFLAKLKTTFVSKDGTKGLSDENFTTSLKNKLNGVANNADCNVITAIKVNGTALSVTDKTVEITVPDVSDYVANDDLIEATEAEVNALFTTQS